MKLRFKIGAVIKFGLKYGMPSEVGRVIDVLDDAVIICYQRKARLNGVSSFNQGHYTADTSKQVTIERLSIGTFSYATFEEATAQCTLDPIPFEESDSNITVSSYDNDDYCKGDGEDCSCK